MKKRLFLLPLVGGLLLSGCTFTLFGKEISLFEKKNKSNDSTTPGTNQPTESTKDPKAPSADLTIDHAAMSSGFIEGKTYPGDFQFTLSDFVFDAVNVGQKTANQSGGNYLNEQKCLQFSSSKSSRGQGVISNFDPIIASKITVHFLATFDSEGADYLPVVKTGDKASNLTTSVSCNEGSSQTGKSTGGKEFVKTNNFEGDKDVYSYTCTYNISGKNFFSVGAGQGAMYVTDIIIHK